MERELRQKIAGVLFYITLIFSLGVTKQGQCFIVDIASKSVNSGNYQALAALLSVGALLFTSEALGFLFSSLHIFSWNIIPRLFHYDEGGYSYEFAKLDYNIRDEIIKKYNEANGGLNNEDTQTFKQQMKAYNLDPFLSFFWQQAPSEIVEWTTRRYTAFLAGGSAVFALLTGWLLSIIIIKIYSLDGTSINNYFAISVLLFAGAIFCNAWRSKKDALQMISLWLNNRSNEKLQEINKTYL